MYLISTCPQERRINRIHVPVMTITYVNQKLNCELSKNQNSLGSGCIKNKSMQKHCKSGQLVDFSEIKTNVEFE